MWTDADSSRSWRYPCLTREFMALLTCWWPLGTEFLLEKVLKFEEQGRARLVWKFHDSWAAFHKSVQSWISWKWLSSHGNHFPGHGAGGVFCISIWTTEEFSCIGVGAKFGLLRLVLNDHFWQLKMEASGLPITFMGRCSQGSNSLLLNWLAQPVMRPLNKAVAKREQTCFAHSILTSSIAAHCLLDLFRGHMLAQSIQY